MPCWKKSCKCLRLVMVIACYRLAAGRSLLQGLASTPRRRGVPFTRVRRRGLCSMSGRYPYGIGNPPTLRRSSFPQRALRPAGAPYQNALGAVPQDPLTLKLRLDTNDVNIVRTAPQIRSQGACGAFYFGPSRDQIKNQPYKRRLAPDPGGRRPSGRGVPTRYGSLGRSPE